MFIQEKRLVCRFIAGFEDGESKHYLHNDCLQASSSGSEYTGIHFQCCIWQREQAQFDLALPRQHCVTLQASTHHPLH